MQKNEYFHQCEDANIPSGFIPWHMACNPDSPSKSACELGSLCRRRAGRSYCEPVEDMVLVKPGSAGCGGGGCTAAGAAGVAFLVLGLLALLGACGFGALHGAWHCVKLTLCLLARTQTRALALHELRCCSVIAATGARCRCVR